LPLVLLSAKISTTNTLPRMFNNTVVNPNWSKNTSNGLKKNSNLLSDNALKLIKKVFSVRI
jgi:hypothetical protein